MESEGETSAVGKCVSTKRKLSSSDDSERCDNKLSKLDVPYADPSAPSSSETSVASITHLPNALKIPVHYLESLSDYVLLILFSYLNSTDLYHLSLCSRRLYNVCRDKTLWYRVRSVCDGRSLSYISMRSYFNDSTTHVQLSKMTVDSSNEIGEATEDLCFDKRFFKSLKHLPNLRTFISENHCLNAATLNLKYFPESITELRLTKITLLNVNSGENGFFHNVHKKLPNLEIVDVSFCQWLHPQILVPLSKCPKLKALYMTGCSNMRNIIPYASIASMFGYPYLETLDLRFTYLSDSEVGCFNKIKNLKHILLEKPENVGFENEEESITDMCTTNLGMRNWRPNVEDFYIYRVPIEGGDFEEDTLETLVIRNYPRVTNITLKHAEKCLKSLKYLDVTGTSCSAEQITIFKNHRPDVKLVHDGLPV